MTSRDPPGRSRLRLRRPLRIVSTCINAAGQPDFALTTLLTAADDSLCTLYDLVEEQLQRRGYERPFVHFTPQEAPPFLFPAVEAYLYQHPSRKEIKR